MDAPVPPTAPGDPQAGDPQGGVQRAATRLRTLLPAFIERPDGGGQLPCIVRDLSDTGAKIQISESITLPNRFRFSIMKLGRHHDARMRWRRGDMAGIEFGPEEAEGHKAPAADEAYVRRLEAENARMRKIIEAIRADPSKARLILEG